MHIVLAFAAGLLIGGGVVGWSWKRSTVRSAAKAIEDGIAKAKADAAATAAAVKSNVGK